jgi:hypothetical protein
VRAGILHLGDLDQLAGGGVGIGEGGDWMNFMQQTLPSLLNAQYLPTMASRRSPSTSTGCELASFRYSIRFAKIP